MGLLSWLMPVTIALSLALEARADGSERKAERSAGPFQASSAEREPAKTAAGDATKRDTAKKERPPVAPKKKTTSAAKKPAKGNDAQLGSASRRELLGGKGKQAQAKKGAQAVKKPSKGRV